MGPGGSNGAEPIEFETAWPPDYVAASQHWGVGKLQKQLAINPSKAPPVKGDTLLCVAARFGNIKGIELLLERGYDPNEWGSGIRTLVLYAYHRS